MRSTGYEVVDEVLPIVLLVDDDAAARDVISDTLREAGYHVAGAADGVAALEAMERGPRPALILLDLMMPRMGGCEVIAAMASRPHLAGIPIVVLTAFAREEIPTGRQVLHKPVEATLLVELVRAILDQEERVAFAIHEPPSDLMPRLVPPAGSPAVHRHSGRH
jgi:CheY-like chemotaxis protein